MSGTVFQQVSIRPGSEILFGRYPQGADGASLPIAWQVLDIRGGRALLLSRYILDVKPYHEAMKAVYWKNASLRAWLNRSFLDSAFSPEEKQRIAPSVEEEDPLWESRWGLTAKDAPLDALSDAVFLLGDEDMRQYFLDGDSDYQRAMTQPTAHAAALLTETPDESGWAKWWLRSTASKLPLAIIVNTNKALSAGGVMAQLGVRPALWVLLDGAEYRQPASKKCAENDVPEYHAGLAPVGGNAAQPLASCSQVRKGDIVSLGAYPQGKNGEVYPIEWVVLAVNGKNALLLSRYILDVQRFSAQKGDPFWGHSHLRSWLAHTYAPKAFSAEDKRGISLQLWEGQGEEGCDAVFLLSRQDMNRYFPGVNELFCPGAVTQITPWAYETYAREVAMDQLGWWLRSSSDQNDFVYTVSPAASIGITINPHETLQGVRPAVWVRIDLQAHEPEQE